MFKNFAIAVGAAAVAAGAAQAENFTGAGATFPAPVYAAWAQAYKSSTNNELNYQAIGSGGGIKQIKAKTVDFGATDKPLQVSELNEAGLIQFPTVVGGVVPIINMKGLRPGRLRLTGAVLGEIYLGHITRWNDPQITRLNPQIRMPPLPITVVHRADGSGTSFIYTSYLARTSPAWSRAVGANDTVNWPVGIGGKGNDGVAAFVKQTTGAIGYVEYIYARKDPSIPFALVQNAAGQFPQPNAASFGAAAASAPWGRAPGNYVLLINQPGANAWPISGATFILLYKNPANPATTANVLRFFDWAYKNGDATASRLDYVPLPLAVKNTIRHQWASEIQSGGKPVYVSK
jgi:phosphate transport system substrate-binding protein